MKIKHQYRLLAASLIMIPLLTVGISALSRTMTMKAIDRDWLGQTTALKQALRTGDWRDVRIDASLLKKYELDFVIAKKEGPVVFSTIPGVAAGSDFIQAIYPLMPPNRFSGIIIRPELALGEGDYRGQDYLMYLRLKKGAFNTPQFNELYLRVLGFSLLALLGIIAGAIIGMRRVVRSIESLNAQARSADALRLSRPVAVKGSFEVRSLAAAINEMRAAIRQNDLRRSHFMMGMSHDFKTPLALVRGYTEVLQANSRHGQALNDDHFGIIIAKVDKLEDMIDSLMDFIALDAEMYNHSFKPVWFKRWLEAYARRSGVDAALLDRAVEYRADLPEDLLVSLDERLAERAFDNLVQNAVKHTSPGGRIGIVADAVPGGLRVVVSDDGEGIPEADLPFIFDTFYRGTRSRNSEGLGIGLAVVNSVVNLHGWTISVRSVLGEGTDFEILIPGGLETGKRGEQGKD